MRRKQHKMSVKCGEDKWKNVLLKSGLPLEHVAAKILAKRQCRVFGEYTYNRLDESRLEKSFSVDLWAIHGFPWKGHRAKKSVLTFLIECKYAYPGSQWFFTPNLGSHSNPSVISTIDQFAASSTDQAHRNLLAFNREFPYAFKGVEVPETNAVDKGGFQLRFALPVLAKHLLLSQYLNPLDSQPIFICPILLTTAKLFVLKETATLGNFHAAKDITDIAKPVRALIWSQSPDDTLEQFSLDQGGVALARDGNVYKRLDELHTLRCRGSTFAPKWYVDQVFRQITKSVLVVNFEYFDKTVERVIQTLSDAQSSILPFAKFKRMEDGSIVVLPWRMVPKAR